MIKILSRDGYEIYINAKDVSVIKEHDRDRDWCYVIVKGQEFLTNMYAYDLRNRVEKELSKTE